MAERYPFPVVPVPLAPLYRVRALRRWTASVWRMFHRVLRSEFSTIRVRGQYFVIDPFDSIGRTLAVWRSYEPEQMCMLYDLSREFRNPVFVDVGANIGIYSLFFARDPRFREIVGVEPDPQNFAFLALHHDMNGADPRFRLHEVAASDVAGLVRFFAVHARNRGASLISDKPDGGLRPEFRGRSIEVTAVPLDDLLSYRGEELVIKLDVEERELRALRGMGELLRKNRCVVQLETHWRDEGQCGALLSEYGYKRVETAGRHAYYATS
ncbi:MAG: FkbM family methyltransferase [Planctomycetota bacterium]|jgi:FkbM family methyltransferase